MFRWRSKLFLAAAAAAVLLAQEQAVIRVDVRLVHILATVRNKDHQLVGGLHKEDFEIIDNGAPQQVAVFERQTDQPLSIALLMDVSASTAIDLKSEIDSATRFLHALLNEGNPKDQVALYAFDDRVTLEQAYTHNFTLLQERLRRIHGSAGTSLYDAVFLAARDGLEARSGRKAMVIVSDGGNTTSRYDSHQALEAAQIADVVIYPVVIMPVTNEAGRNIGGEHVLTFMAQSTGGRAFQATLGSSLDRTFSDIISELRTEYLLSFYPRNVPLTRDRYHKLTVRVKQPDLQVSARNGYYGEAEGFSASPEGSETSAEPVAKKKKR
jgi:Ca-activated chloride channel family protein